MSTNPDEPDPPQPLARYMRGNSESAELGLPPGGSVRARGSGADAHSSTCSVEPFLEWEGDWQVYDHTKANYPVVMIDRDARRGVACTLRTVNHDWITTATLGYGTEIGTFTIISCSQRDCSIGEDEIKSFQSTDQIQELIKSSDSSWFSTSDTISMYRWQSVAGHQPWKAMRESCLGGFSILQTRYEVVADELGKRFDPTPPSQRYKSEPRKDERWYDDTNDEFFE